jgi:hypothetical protein
LPFYFGFLLVGGMLMMIAGHYLTYKEENEEYKFHLLLSIAWTTVFAALIFFNYICQTTFIHNLALHYKPEYDFAITTFSMSNPLSLCWAIEMWGYGFLGVATWLIAGYYRDRSNIIRVLLILNGIVSLISPIYTIINVRWVMKSGGLIAYFAWNALMILMLILIYRFHTRSTDLMAIQSTETDKHQ